MEMVAIQPHALRHMGLGYITNPAESLRRRSMLPSHFFTQKAMRKCQFRTLERQQIIGRPGKKLRLRYARQRRPNPFHWRKSACRRIHERWSNRSTLQYYFVGHGQLAHWYVDNRDGSFSFVQAGRAWAHNLSGVRTASN
jgi:hypothetical protein